MGSCAASRAALAGALAAGALAAQDDVTLHAAFAARSARLTVPAIEWLCATHLPARPEWPPTLDPDRPFALVLSARGLRILDSRIPLPHGVAAAGSCTFGDGEPLLWSCGADGVEDWFAPTTLRVPAAWRSVLAALELDRLHEPRTVDVAVIVAHLAGPAVDGDRHAELLRLGSSLCGRVACTAWSTDDAERLRVRGRSDGGLLLPALLLALAAANGTGVETTLALRAFAARDGDRAEAARQFARTPGDRTIATLRALLHADDAVALAAIDALVRLRATDELPAIVAAASPDAPWASLAAADALRALWRDASPAVRARTRAAAARSRSLIVREVDLDRLPARAAPAVEAPVDDGSSRARALLLMALFAIGLHGLWVRERGRLRTGVGDPTT